MLSILLFLSISQQCITEPMTREISHYKLLSGSLILLLIIWKSKVSLQNISRWIVGNVLIDISSMTRKISHHKLLPGSLILLLMIWKSKVSLQNIPRRVVMFWSIFLLQIFSQLWFKTKRFHQNFQAAFGRCKHLWVNQLKTSHGNEHIWLYFSYLWNY